jgi:hypothetical protein
MGESPYQCKESIYKKGCGNYEEIPLLQTQHFIQHCSGWVNSAWKRNYWESNTISDTKVINIQILIEFDSCKNSFICQQWSFRSFLFNWVN